MVRDEEIIRELIAERARIDKLINSYQSRNGELSAVVPVTKPKEYSFHELMERSLGAMSDADFDDGMDELCTTTEIRRGISTVSSIQINRPVTTNNVTVNIDNSCHTTTHSESHVNTTLAGGDKVIDALGGLLHNLFN